MPYRKNKLKEYNGWGVTHKGYRKTRLRVQNWVFKRTII